MASEVDIEVMEEVYKMREGWREGTSGGGT